MIFMGRSIIHPCSSSKMKIMYFFGKETKIKKPHQRHCVARMLMGYVACYRLQAASSQYGHTIPRAVSMLHRVKLDRAVLEVNATHFETIHAVVHFHGNIVVDLDDFLIHGREKLVAGLHHAAYPQ